jgi:probable rRNA maturation factor
MILNRQRRVRVSLRELDRFVMNAGELLHLPTDSVTVCLVTDAEMARWNHAYRGKHAPTDVLSFPANTTGSEPRAHRGRKERDSSSRKTRRVVSGDDNSDAAYLGDIAIAPLVARRNALRFGRTFEYELRILILHGMIHLLGYDHETDTGQMDRRERRLRRALGLE